MTSGWQPIETAPRDGTEFLCGWFYRDRFLWDVGKVRRLGNGLHVFSRARSTHTIYPSHWMPLPPPPKKVRALAIAGK